MKIKLLICAVFAGIAICGCAAKWANQLEVHHSSLTKTASSKMPPTEKLDTLLNSFAIMMHQSLDRLSPKTGVKYVQSYAEVNEKAIIQILQDVRIQTKDMSGGERLAMGVGFITKPYAKDFRELLPRFQRKYAQYKLISSLSKKVKNELLDIAGGALGL